MAKNSYFYYDHDACCFVEVQTTSRKRVLIGAGIGSGLLIVAVVLTLVMDQFIRTPQEVALMDENTGIVVEPGGSSALTAVLSGQLKAKPGSNIGVILSGGNVDEDVFAMAAEAKDKFLVGPAG